MSKLFKAGFEAYKAGKIRAPSQCNIWFSYLENLSKNESSKKICEEWNAGFNAAQNEELQKSFPEMYA